MKGNQISSRPPIVVVLGHVDHGKTTLLDRIRKTDIAGKEAGGITQGIGASVIETTEKKKITFIDTPGHAAFSKMRSRGANLADVAILVIAAHGGIKPQTREALDHIKEAKIPYIVAVTKIDLPSSSVESTVEQLEKEGVSFEKKGGDVPLVPVSGKTGEGVVELLEMISLVAEIGEVKGDSAADFEGIVIETDKDKRGALVSVVVRNGTLQVTDEVSAEGIKAKVRGLFDDKRRPVKKAEPGEPVQILGFSEMPPVGSLLKKSSQDEGNLTVKKTVKTVQKTGKGNIFIVVKAANSGSLEAIITNLPDKVLVISSGIGDVNESDIFYAKSNDDVQIFAFESRVSPSVQKLANTEGVKINRFDVIYDLFDTVEELIKAGEEQILGKAEIIADFPYDKIRVAGARVTEGEIKKQDEIVLIRGINELGKSKIKSLKKQKQNVESVKTQEEFGILFEPQLDFAVGDVIISTRKK